MKALVCLMCNDIRSLDPKGEWTVCRCGQLEARWLNPNAGTVRVKADHPSFARMLGLNNRYLIGACRGPDHHEMVAAGGQWEWWRELHDKATEAPGYIFDKTKRACWATVVRVGETNDITWEPEEEPKPC
jgi:hypothetical protein